MRNQQGKKREDSWQWQWQEEGSNARTSKAMYGIASSLGMFLGDENERGMER